MQCAKCKLRVRCTFTDTETSNVSERHYEKVNIKVRYAWRIFFLTSVFSRRSSREMARELVSATSLHNEIIMFSATTFLHIRKNAKAQPPIIECNCTPFTMHAICTYTHHARWFRGSKFRGFQPITLSINWLEHS